MKRNADLIQSNLSDEDWFVSRAVHVSSALKSQTLSNLTCRMVHVSTFTGQNESTVLDW